ncbi:4-nitrophenylphosphatase isoform X1 [Lucilia cuprina]|uniref:4-nitrophenylphosphatase isoform X1 n=1 Tax=Lucilia cuprina TaxID=7375 RepID=UPI001F064A05|nr:4-nitrophenylphosphatase isoform X1 [Lucilia cuprina]
MSYQLKSTDFLNNLTLEEKQNFLDSFDLVFCDCDGASVIWQNFYDEIPGSSDAVKYLRNIGKHVAFVTNNSIISTKDQLSKFASCGLEIEENDLIHPAKTICDYLKMENFEGLILCFASRVFKEHLHENGFQIVEEDERFIKNGSLSDLYHAIYTQEEVNAVIIDVDFNLTAWKLMRAQVHLKNPQCLFIAGAADPQIPFGGNELIGPGAYIKIVEEANQCKAKIFGKPGVELGELLFKIFNIENPERVLMLGDSLKSDIQFGKMCGFQTLLVLTGGTKPDDLDSLLTEENKPDYIVEKLADLNDFI